MNNWMQRLAQHYDEMRREHPEDDLLILFDIDGTILDMRHMVRHVLHEFDREHGSGFFRNLRLEDIEVHENNIAKLLQRLRLAPKHKARIQAWYEKNLSCASALPQHIQFVKRAATDSSTLCRRIRSATSSCGSMEMSNGCRKRAFGNS